MEYIFPILILILDILLIIKIVRSEEPAKLLWVDGNPAFADPWAAYLHWGQDARRAAFGEQALSTGMICRLLEPRGIEPRFAECDSAVIPLDHGPGVFNCGRIVGVTAEGFKFPVYADLATSGFSRR